MLFCHVKHVLAKLSVPPVADNQDDDHSNISKEENVSDSDSKDEESGSSSDQEPSKSSEEEFTSSSSGKDGDAKVWFSPVLHFFWQTENWT